MKLQVCIGQVFLPFTVATVHTQGKFIFTFLLKNTQQCNFLVTETCFQFDIFTRQISYALHCGYTINSQGKLVYKLI